jgi:hypothetical protein
MSRQSKILILSHLYPLYIIADLQWELGDLIFNVLPFFIYGLLMYVWLRTSIIKLNKIEKNSLGFLIIFQCTFSIYYEFCTLMTKYIDCDKWVKEHSGYMLYLVIFIATFYSISHLINEQR